MNYNNIVILGRKFLITLGILVIYRIGTYIPAPLSSYSSTNLSSGSSGIFGMFNLLSGGALSRMAIFSLNVVPYIIASITNQLIKSDKKNSSGDVKNEKEQIKILSMGIGILQATFISLNFYQFGNNSSYIDYMLLFLNIITLVGGVFLLLWLGENITNRGIGNGISLIIFTSIVAEMPNSFVSITDAGYFDSKDVGVFFTGLLISLLMIVLIVVVEKSYRNILVHYPRRQASIGVSNDSSLYMPLRINTAGVIPPIFANAILVLPLSIASFYQKKYVNCEWLNSVLSFFVPGSVIYNVIYVLLIVFFCFFYTSIVFNAGDAADGIRKNGGVITGVRPGKETEAYIMSIVNRLTFWGALYIAVICIISEVMRKIYMIPSAIGGTSLLIVVGVITDTISQVQVYLFTGQYKKLSRRVGIRSRVK